MTHLGLLAVALVAGGEPKASVVLPADARPHERTAAEELVKWTRELTGATLPVAAAPQPGLTPVRFARADAEVRNDGFSISASEKEVVIAANEDIGILFGVYYALNRFGGIYWCHPESGADFTPAAGFAIPDGRLVKTPMAVRCGHAAGNGALSTPARRERVAWWNVRNGFATRSYRRGRDPAKTQPGNSVPNGLLERLGDWGEAETGGHALGALVLETPIEDRDRLREETAWVRAHADELFVTAPRGDQVSSYARWRVLVRQHPAWFGLVNGARVPTGVSLRQGTEIKGPSAMPCLSNPEVRARICQGFKARQAKDFPGIPVTFRLCCDDQSQWCECDACMRLLTCKGPKDDRGKASDYWWDFVNDIAARLLEDPLVSVKVYVYRTYQAFPSRVKPVPRERLSIVLCPHGRCYLHALADPRCKANAPYREMFAAWARIGMPIDAFEYMNQVPGKCNYAFWERAWIEDVKWYMANGVSHGSGGLVGPWDGYATADDYFRRNAAKARWQVAWLSGRFEWDPDDDFDAVRDRLFSAYYRRAAKPMKAYRALLEKAIYATGQCMCYGAGGSLFSAAAFQPGVLTEAKRLLGEAAARATGDAELERRVAADAGWFASNWEAAGISGDTAVAMTRAPAAPTLDGRLDELFWRQATAIDDFRAVGAIGDTPKLAEERFAPATTMRLAFDATDLYLACVCAKEGDQAADVPADGSTFEAMRGSHLEFFFQAPGLGGKYYHVAVSHDGKVYSALTTSGKARDLAKRLPVRHAIADTPEAWTLEMAVPLAEFGGAKPGDLWKIDVSRAAAGKDGAMLRARGSLCGYGAHMPEYWKAFSFGAPSNLLANGSFEDLVAPPVLGPGNRLNGKGWRFLSEKVPAKWFYQQNGGIAEAVTAGAADGRAFLRLKNVARGRECYLWQDIGAYPDGAKAMRFSFRARGRGQVTARVIRHPEETARVKTAVDAADWREHACEIPLGGLHPTRFMVNVGAESLDLDDFRLEPAE